MPLGALLVRCAAMLTILLSSPTLNYNAYPHYPHCSFTHTHIYIFVKVVKVPLSCNNVLNDSLMGGPDAHARLWRDEPQDFVKDPDEWDHGQSKSNRGGCSGSGSECRSGPGGSNGSGSKSASSGRSYLMGTLGVQSIMGRSCLPRYSEDACLSPSPSPVAIPTPPLPTTMPALVCPRHGDDDDDEFEDEWEDVLQRLRHEALDFTVHAPPLVPVVARMALHDPPADDNSPESHKLCRLKHAYTSCGPCIKSSNDDLGFSPMILPLDLHESYSSRGEQ